MSNRLNTNSTYADCSGSTLRNSYSSPRGTELRPWIVAENWGGGAPPLLLAREAAPYGGFWLDGCGCLEEQLGGRSRCAQRRGPGTAVCWASLVNFVSLHSLRGCSA